MPMPNSSRQKFVVGAIASLPAAAFVTGKATPAQFQFKCSSQYPTDHPISVRLTQMLAAIERETGGRLHVDYFPNSTLGGSEAMFSQLRLGAVQLLIIGANFGAVVAAGDISNLGFAFKDELQALHVMDGPVGEWVRAESQAKNIHALRTMWLDGMLHVTAGTHAVITPEDLRNFKIKVGGKISSDLFKTLGGSPVRLDLSETYVAMQTKLVDGASSTIPVVETTRQYEVQKYLSLTNHQFSGIWLIVNGDAWKGLPADIHDVIARNNTKYALLQRRDEELLIASLADKLTRQGMTFRHVDQALFRSHLSSYYSEWAGNFGSTGWSLLQNALGRKLA